MMNDEQIKALTEEVRELKESVKRLETEMGEIKKALVGNKLAGVLGVVDILDQQRKEIHGDRNTQHLGLKEQNERHDERLRSLEGDRGKLIAYAVATSFGVGLLWILAKQFIFK